MTILEYNQNRYTYDKNEIKYIPHPNRRVVDAMLMMFCFALHMFKYLDCELNSFDDFQVSHIYFN